MAGPLQLFGYLGCFMWRNNSELFTYDWINIETFCVSLFGIWFAYGVAAWWLSGKPWNWFVKFVLLTLAVLPMAAIEAYDLLQILWAFGATILLGRAMTEYLVRLSDKRRLRNQNDPSASDTRLTDTSTFKPQWSIKNLLLATTALAVSIVVFTRNTEDLGLIPVAYAAGFGVLGGCVLLVSTTIGKYANRIWITLALFAAATGQYLAFSFIFQEPTFSNLFEAIEGTSFIWGETEDFTIAILLTIAFCFLVFGFSCRWMGGQEKQTTVLGRAAQVLIGAVMLMQCVLIGDLFRKVSVTHQVQLNRLQEKADLAQEQAVLIENTELYFSGYYPPDETQKMIAAVRDPLTQVEQILQNVELADSEVTFVQELEFDTWDFLDDIQRNRTTARAFGFRSEWARSQGNHDAALKDAVHTMKLPMIFIDHRTLVTRLGTIGIEGMGAYQAAPNIGGASDLALSKALTELLKIEADEVDAEVDYQNDWALSWHSLNWMGRLEELSFEGEHQANFRTNIQQNVYRSQVTRRQLIVMLALELHQRKYGELPDQLETLTPEFLPNVPLDPFNDSESPAFLTYRRDGLTYLLYSLGTNGEDDGGCNPEFGYGTPDEGDLNFPDAVRQTLLDEQADRESALQELRDAENNDEENGTSDSSDSDAE